jgi:hypothetical protein
MSESRMRQDRAHRPMRRRETTNITRTSTRRGRKNLPPTLPRHTGFRQLAFDREESSRPREASALQQRVAIGPPAGQPCIDGRTASCSRRPSLASFRTGITSVVPWLVVSDRTRCSLVSSVLAGWPLWLPTGSAAEARFARGRALSSSP